MFRQRPGWLLVLILPGLSTEALAQASTQTQLIASSCAACHGTQGRSVGGTPVLAALNRDYFLKQMEDFASGARPATVMQLLAKGFTDEQLQELADYFAKQKR